MSEWAEMTDPNDPVFQERYRRLVRHLDTCTAYTLDIDCPWLRRYRQGEMPDDAICRPLPMVPSASPAREAAR